MNRLLFCEPSPVSEFKYSIDRFLEGISSLFCRVLWRSRRALHFLPVLPFVAAFLAGAFLVSLLLPVLARGFVAAFLAAGFFAAVFFFVGCGASSSAVAGAAATTFSRLARGPMLGLLSLVRISVTRNTVISSR